MIERKELGKFIRKQLDYVRRPTELPKPNTSHYGRQEIKELLDLIYGGPPMDKGEELP